MRLLGNCPSCQVTDSISTQEEKGSAYWAHAACISCGTGWGNWRELVESEGNWANILIPVSVEHTLQQVLVRYPDEYFFPFKDQMVRVLNTALYIRFGLEPAFGSEGGVEGLLRKEYPIRAISLENISEGIGLYDEYWDGDWGKPNPVLAWYADLLSILLERQLVVAGMNYGRGAIMRISPMDPEAEAKVRALLYLAIVAKTRRRSFAQRVFDRARVDCESGVGSFVVGIRCNEISKRFVQLP